MTHTSVPRFRTLGTGSISEPESIDPRETTTHMVTVVRTHRERFLRDAECVVTPRTTSSAPKTPHNVDPPREGHATVPRTIENTIARYITAQHRHTRTHRPRPTPALHPAHPALYRTSRRAGSPSPRTPTHLRGTVRGAYVPISKVLKATRVADSRRRRLVPHQFRRSGIQPQTYRTERDAASHTGPSSPAGLTLHAAAAPSNIEGVPTSRQASHRAHITIAGPESRPPRFAALSHTGCRWGAEAVGCLGFDAFSVLITQVSAPRDLCTGPQLCVLRLGPGRLGCARLGWFLPLPRRRDHPAAGASSQRARLAALNRRPRRLSRPPVLGRAASSAAFFLSCWTMPCAGHATSRNDNSRLFRLPRYRATGPGGRPGSLASLPRKGRPGPWAWAHAGRDVLRQVTRLAAALWPLRVGTSSRATHRVARVSAGYESSASTAARLPGEAFPRRQAGGPSVGPPRLPGSACTGVPEGIIRGLAHGPVHTPGALPLGATFAQPFLRGARPREV